MTDRLGETRLRCPRKRAATGAVVLGAVLLTACGSSGGTASAGSSGSAASTSSSAPSTTAAAGQPASGGQGITLMTASVSGYGTILVDGTGHTLYILSSEQGGKITCTDANGCTKIWPDTELPAGMTSATAGPGVKPSLLSTVKDAAGSLYVTYGGWPLYTFSRDSAAGQVNGEGITSFGGTWYVLDASGNPVKSSQSSSAPASGSYGY